MHLRNRVSPIKAREQLVDSLIEKSVRKIQAYIQYVISGTGLSDDESQR